MLFRSLGRVRLLDWVGILTMGGRPEGASEFVVALIVQILWDGLLGIIFAYLMPGITSRGHLIKGAIYGFTIAFAFRSVAALYRLPFLSQRLNLGSYLSTLFGAIVWGIITAWILRRLDRAPT